jgi:hypothetical protein
MALMFHIEDATQLDENVWRAQLSPSELRLLDPRAETSGAITILLLSGEPRFDSEKKSLAFDPSKAKLLNAGTSAKAIVVGGAAANHTVRDEKVSGKSRVGSGDARFLNSLPRPLQDLGAKLLDAVRSKYPGELVFYESSGKYVQAPDNFWTVRPQPRDQSFRITVRGKPESFANTGTLVIKPDMGSYSSFKVDRPTQLQDFIRVLEQVRKK